MRLGHPFVAGASPLGYHLDTIKRLEDAGCAAVVLHSLFEEQITDVQAGHVAHVDVFEDTGGHGTLSAFPSRREYPFGPDEYAEHVQRAKHAVSIPVIGFMNGRTPESWLKFARVIEQAGADALELNMERGPDRAVGARHRDRRSAGRGRQGLEASAQASCGGQAVAVLHRLRQRCAPPRSGRRRRPRAVQPLPSTGHRHSIDDRGPAGGALYQR